MKSLHYFVSTDGWLDESQQILKISFLYVDVSSISLLTAFLLQKLNNSMSFNLIGQRDKDGKEVLTQSAESPDWGVIEK